MKCPSCYTTVSGVYEAGDYTCSGCSAQLRVKPSTPKTSRKVSAKGAHNRKFLAAASELGQTYGEVASSMGRGRGKTALAKDLEQYRNPTSGADYSGYKPLSGHISEETAYIVDDYPYGFRLRTQIRYWVETKKGKGQRFVSQTLNPKTSRWNKPKASIYSTVVMMALDVNENYHVKNVTMSEWASGEALADFAAWAEGYLTEWQIGALDYLGAVRRAGEKTTWTTHVCPGPDCPETHQTREEQGQIMGGLISKEMRRPESTNNPVTPDGVYYGKGAFVESVAGAVERKKATGKRAYIYEGAGSTRQDPTYVLDKKYSRNKRSVGHTYDSDNFYVTKALNPTNNPSWRNPQQLSFEEPYE